MKIALIAAAALAMTLSVSGCSSDGDSAAAGSDSNESLPTGQAPVRVGVEEFANVIAEPGVVILDVRTPEEFASGHISGAINIPVENADFIDQVSQLDPAVTYAVYCRSGNRSQPAVAGMQSAGINGIVELESGTIGWADAGQPLVS